MYCPTLKSSLGSTPSLVIAFIVVMKGLTCLLSTNSTVVAIALKKRTRFVIWVFKFTTSMMHCTRTALISDYVKESFESEARKRLMEN